RRDAPRDSLSQHKPTQREIDEPTVLKSTYEQVGAQQDEQRPLHVVESGAAEVDVPRRCCQQRGRQDGGAAPPEAAYQEVQQKDGEDTLDHRTHAESEQVVSKNGQ